MDFIPGWGRSPGEGKDNPLQYSCLGNSMDRGAWRATVHGVAKSQTRRKWLSTYTDFINADALTSVPPGKLYIYIYIYIYIGEGNGTHSSTLAWKFPWTKEPGAWWATVHGVAKSRTWLSDFTFTFMYIYIIRTVHFLKGTFKKWFIHLKESFYHLPWMDHFFSCVRGWSVRGILTLVGGFNGQLLCWKLPVWAFALEMGSGNEKPNDKTMLLSQWGQKWLYSGYSRQWNVWEPELWVWIGE